MGPGLWAGVGLASPTPVTHTEIWRHTDLASLMRSQCVVLLSAMLCYIVLALLCLLLYVIMCVWCRVVFCCDMLCCLVLCLMICAVLLSVALFCVLLCGVVWCAAVLCVSSWLSSVGMFVSGLLRIVSFFCAWPFAVAWSGLVVVCFVVL